MKNPVGWFELPVTDLARAKKFYTDVFNFVMGDTVSQGEYDMSFFPMDPKAPQASGSLSKGPECVPSSNSGVIIYFSVDDIEATCSRASAHGGAIKMPKFSIGEWGFMALVIDTEGNKIGLHSMK